jgi:hypothetical protein
MAIYYKVRSRKANKMDNAEISFLIAMNCEVQDVGRPRQLVLLDQPAPSIQLNFRWREQAERYAID